MSPMSDHPPGEHVPRRVLVTGGAGFVGSHFVQHLLATDPTVQVVNLDLLTYAGSSANLERLRGHDRYAFVEGDVCDGPLVTALLGTQAIDTIVHFAAESHVDRSVEDPARFARTNAHGTFTLLEAARRVWLVEKKLPREACRFHHVSTDEVYGALRSGDPPFTERTAYAPNSPYAASKAAADHFVRAYHRTYGLPTVTTHSSNNYGPYQHDEKLIPTIIRACLAGAPIPIYGDGTNVRDWLYVTDHCAGIDAVLRRGRTAEVYNVGGGGERTNLDVARHVCRELDAIVPAGAPHERLVTFVADRPGHDFRYAMDASKIEDELGWRTTVPFARGIHTTVAAAMAKVTSPPAET